MDIDDAPVAIGALEHPTGATYVPFDSPGHPHLLTFSPASSAATAVPPSTGPPPPAPCALPASS